MALVFLRNRGEVEMKKIILLLIMISVLIGCANGDRYNFSGSSKNWNVFYVVDVSNGNEQSTTETIKYTGEEPAPETIDYKIEANSGGSEGTGKTLDNGTTNTGSSICEGCAVIQEDEEIEVEIKWDDQTENLILTTDK